MAKNGVAYMKMVRLGFGCVQGTQVEIVGDVGRAWGKKKNVALANL